jgi:cold shock CspA family protein
MRRIGVQGTIKHYDTDNHSGSLLTDDRTEIAIDDRSLADPSILMLRIGQRVRFEVEATDGGSVARSLHLVTF